MVHLQKQVCWSAITMLLVGLLLAQAAPAAPPLEPVVLASGLAGNQFRLQRKGPVLTIETGEQYTDATHLKLVLVGLTRLVAGRDHSLVRVVLRARLLDALEAVEASITPALARSVPDHPEQLARIRLQPASGATTRLATLPAVGSPPHRPVPGGPRDRARLDLPVIGEPLRPGQAVADRGTGGEDGFVVHAGNPILVQLQESVSPTAGQPVAVEAVVNQSVVGARGTIVIPAGSRVFGAVEATDRGAQLVLHEIEIGERRLPLAARSEAYPAEPVLGRASPGAAMAASYGGLLVGGPIGGLLGLLVGALVGQNAGAPAKAALAAVPAGPVTVRLEADLSAAP